MRINYLTIGFCILCVYLWKKSKAAAILSDAQVTAKAESGDYIYKKDTPIIIKNGILNLTVTGAIVVKAASVDSFDAIAARVSMDIQYKAPQIAVVILQARDGQNLTQKLVELRNDPNVFSAYLEIYDPSMQPVAQ